MTEPPDLFLPRRFDWLRRALLSGYPVEPQAGDRGPTKDALIEVVDAASGFEYSRLEVLRTLALAQSEFDNIARTDPPDTSEAGSWDGRNSPAVYYAFYNAVAWMRAIKDRYQERLGAALKEYPEVWNTVQKIRSKAHAHFEDARLLAKCSLHKYTPPYAVGGPRIIAGRTLIYRVPTIVDANDLRANLKTLSDDRHVASITAAFWSTATRFIDEVLDVFYPPTRGVPR